MDLTNIEQRLAVLEAFLLRGETPNGVSSPNSPLIIASNNIDKLAKYSVSREDIATIPEYYGFIAEDGSWYIMRNNTTTGVYTYINGASDFTTNWSNRAGLAYVEFDALNW
jgi:hypothetical protein